MSENIRTLSRETKYTGKVIGVVEERIVLPSGMETTYATVTHHGAVVILPRQNDGRLLFVSQYRHAIGKTILEFPAGMIKVGEDPTEGAKREISEEIGFAAHRWHSLGTIYPAPGFCNELQYLFFATDLYEKKLPGDEDEAIEVHALSIQEIEESIVNGRIVDGKSIAIFTKARLSGLL